MLAGVFAGIEAAGVAGVFAFALSFPFVLVDLEDVEGVVEGVEEAAVVAGAVVLDFDFDLDLDLVELEGVVCVWPERPAALALGSMVMSRAAHSSEPRVNVYILVMWVPEILSIGLSFSNSTRQRVRENMPERRCDRILRLTRCNSVWTEDRVQLLRWLCRLIGDHQLDDFVVGGDRDDVLRLQLRFIGIRAAIDDFLGIDIADTG